MKLATSKNRVKVGIAAAAGAVAISGAVASFAAGPKFSNADAYRVVEESQSIKAASSRSACTWAKSSRSRSRVKAAFLKSRGVSEGARAYRAKLQKCQEILRKR